MTAKSDRVGPRELQEEVWVKTAGQVESTERSQQRVAYKRQMEMVGP
jgi:hypothetical protein